MAATRRVPHLPEELIFKILTLLPVISLLRCRSVCKLWESIISNPEFVQAHLTLSQEKQQSVPSAVLVDAHKKKDRSLYVVNSTEDISKIHLPSKFKGLMNRFFGSCNGLVSIGNYPCADVIYLFNPLTKRSKILPTPKIQPVHEFAVNLGFGFDSISNDYKILRTALTKRSYNVPSALEVEVYSANADSWKEIQVPKILQSISFFPSKCVHSQTGVLYLEGGPLHLLLFDLTNEMFRVYSYPNRAQYEIASNVLDFEGSVGMFFKSVIDRSISMWMLDDACGEVSWTKKFNIEPDLEINQVCLYSGVGQFVARNYFFRYILYDSIKKQTKKYPDFASFTQVNAVIKYTESLVSLKGFEKVD